MAGPADRQSITKPASCGKSSEWLLPHRYVSVSRANPSPTSKALSADAAPSPNGSADRPPRPSVRCLCDWHSKLEAKDGGPVAKLQYLGRSQPVPIEPGEWLILRLPEPGAQLQNVRAFAADQCAPAASCARNLPKPPHDACRGFQSDDGHVRQRAP